MNFWGVTFADDDHFYATMATAGKTYLVSGSFAAHRVEVLPENVACTSLSPDGTRLVFKKRIRPASSGEPWRLYLLDLKTMHESPLAENRSVDDQVDWLDPKTITYGLSGDFGSDLWSVPVDGTGTPQKIINAAASPVVLS
jgi:dipeptidyl aminopeptidase/acylaminoacyl peptidase